MANQNEKYSIQISIDGKDNTSQALSSVNKQLDDMQGGVNRTSQAWSSFKDGVGTALGAFAIAGGFAAAVGQVNELGRAANAADVTFTQLAGGTNEAARGLAQLREATGGVVDDMTLMQGANSLMLTGLASTTQEAANLTEVAVKLGGAMGQNAADAIQNLNAALLNNSFERLDMLGISAGAVRARVNELKETGLDMSEAFAQATLEQGQIALERLGTAADVSNTAMARLQVGATNLAQDIGQALNVKLEEAAVALEQLMILANIFAGGTGGVAEIEAAQAATAEYEAQLASLTASAERYINLSESASFRQTGQRTEIAPFLDTADVARQFSTLTEEIQAEVGTGNFFQTMFGDNATDEMREAGRQMAAGLGEGFQDAPDAFFEQYAADFDRRYKAVADASNVLEFQTEQTTLALEAQARMMADASVYDEYLATQITVVDNLMTMRSELDAFNETMSAGTISTSGATFFDPTALGQVQSQAQALADEYERLKAIGESTQFELVSEAEVERAREIAESANDTAENAERNARAWETASLAMIAGATGGGRLNEFNQMVLGQIQDPELRAQAEGQFNLASGVETANTRVLDYGASLVTAITETFGVAAGTRAGQDFVSSFEEGVQMGLEGEALQDYVESAVGYALEGGATQEVQVQAGEGYIALSQRTGISQEELRAANGNGMLQVGQVLQVGDGTSLIAVNGDPQALTYALNSAQNQIASNLAPEAAAATDSPMQNSMYTYYDPSTYSYSGSNQMATPIPPEQGETLTTAADSMVIIQDASLVISETDLSAVFDPMTGDIEVANGQVLEFEDSLNRISSSNVGVEMPITFVFDNTTAELLSRNSQVVEVIRLVLPQLGVTIP